MQQPSMQPMSNENKLLAALGYPIGIIAVVVLLTDMKNNRFMKFHAVQSLLFILAFVVVYVGSLILTAIVPPLFLVAMLVWIGWLILSIYYAVQAYNGKMFSIPVVGPYAAKYAGGA
ncbi:MAG: DUF4870 domain-containing protein [bacterium]